MFGVLGSSASKGHQRGQISRVFGAYPEGPQNGLRWGHSRSAFPAQGHQAKAKMSPHLMLSIEPLCRWMNAYVAVYFHLEYTTISSSVYTTQFCSHVLNVYNVSYYILHPITWCIVSHFYTFILHQNIV